MGVISLGEFDSSFYPIHEEAKKTFLAGYKYALFLDMPFTGILYNEKTKKTEMHINPSCPLVDFLKKSGLTHREAWLLSLAHESGHLELNDKCLNSGDSPSSPDSQLLAIGIEADLRQKVNSDFHKETAIEAYCDARLAQEAVKIMGDKWSTAVGSLAELRALNSKSVGFLKGDEYATAEMLEFLLKDKHKKGFNAQDISLLDSATRALRLSVNKTSILKERLVKFRESLRRKREEQGGPVKNEHITKNTHN